MVLSVGYRRAPDHPYPAAIEDVLATLEWLMKNVEDIGADKGRIALGGSSLYVSACFTASVVRTDHGDSLSGGSITAVTATMAAFLEPRYRFVANCSSFLLSIIRQTKYLNHGVRTCMHQDLPPRK